MILILFSYFNLVNYLLLSFQIFKFYPNISTTTVIHAYYIKKSCFHDQIKLGILKIFMNPLYFLTCSYYSNILLTNYITRILFAIFHINIEQKDNSFSMYIVALFTRSSLTVHNLVNRQLKTVPFIECNTQTCIMLDMITSSLITL